ncbi:hypothetical protein IFM89_016673 [Coptis chinensis]|uniref:Knottins-like domain-containing protein n=1 Tax=Coptis chinensis TaxID=261450 RepID=A0A835IPW1_9MAGN|nr:hypothetical protein IFM89_016673 [Coptis chinensis]
MSIRSMIKIKAASPTETLQIENGLSLIQRVKLLLTVYRADLSFKPIDEWQFKRSLLSYLKYSLPNTVPEEDLEIHKFKDLKKRKRNDSIASGVLYIRDLAFIDNKTKKVDNLNSEDKFLEWRDSFVNKLDGIELSLEGVKFKLNVSLPSSDDFHGLKKSWEESYAFSNKGYGSRGKQQPDTIILRGVPSRWFAEPRVSSKPSMLVTHTIFSVFGNIRNLNVASDDDLGENVKEGSDDIVSGLQCKVVVQFEKHEDFSNALKVLCGRSMLKEGSHLRADYEATWDRNDFFRNTVQRAARNQIPERSHMQSTATRQYENETPRFLPHIARSSSNGAYSKRFKSTNAILRVKATDSLELSRQLEKCHNQLNFVSTKEEMELVGARRPHVRYCRTPSHGYKGMCFRHVNCGLVCRNEGFAGGSCQGLRRRCFCVKPC